VDDLVLFNSLTKEDIHKIIDIELAKLYSRVEDLGYKLKLTDAAKDYISDKGYDAKFGARPLKRAIQKYVEDALAEEIINSNIQEGDSISIDFDKKKEEISIKVKKGDKKESTNEDED
jgi:ATP-dependent Clp protease ATP-binding subunit ClpC